GKDQGAGGSANEEGWGEEVRDQPAKDGGKMSDAEVEQEVQKVATEVAQAIRIQEKSGGVGSVAGEMKRMFDDACRPKVSWIDYVAQYVQHLATSDSRWSPPNRRFSSRGLYLPSTISDNLGDVVLCVDTSGSINDKQIAQFESDASALLALYSMDLHVLYCDTKLYDHQAGMNHLTQADLPLRLDAKGGGGTVFDKPFKWVDDNDLRPTIFIYLTDMESSDHYNGTPEYPVLWMDYGRGKLGDYWEPPFGERIKIDL
ncbi:VWA-like domain-containing protein, partial [Thermodesulfobacteriota bacterium]